MSDQTAPDEDIWPNDVLAHGTTLNGYRIVRLLGRGGFGVTYLTEDLLGQHFALKEYFPRQFAVRQGMQVRAASAADVAVFDDCRSRFVHEARALIGLGRARFGHQDIVRVQTFFEANGTAYMVMEYIVGRTLQAVMRAHPGGMPAEEIRRILGDILGGLSAVHAAGLMHRDIKPANVLLRDDRHAVLIDFGSSREARSLQTQGFTQIFSGGYAPPEQVMGMRQGPFSDIYAVGAIGYEAIGGKIADAMTRQHAASTRQPAPMPPAAEIGAGRYDSALLAVIDSALALDPADRPESAAAMAQALAEPPPPIAAPHIAAPAVAPHAETPSPTPPRAQAAVPRKTAPTAGSARRWPWFAGAGAAVAAAALGLWVVLGRSPAPPPPPPVVAAVPLPPQPAVLPPTPPPLPPTPPHPAPPVAVPPPVVIPPPPPPVVQAPSLPPTAPVVAPPPGHDTLQAAAARLPCALLTVAQGEGGTITIAGRARHDAGLDDLLRQARAGGRSVTTSIEPVEPGLCPPVTLLADAHRHERAQETLRLALADPVVTAGTSFVAMLQGNGGGMVQVDHYGADGRVHHVIRRQPPSGPWSIRLQLDAPASAGQQMVVALATAAPLDLGSRPTHEPARDYLPVLQRALDRAAQTTAAAPRAEMLFLQVNPATRIGGPAPMPASGAASGGRTPGLSASRCADIVARAQLGEALSDADRTALRTQCRP